MFSHVGLRLHENLDSFTLAELIGPEFIPEVSSSWDVLLPIEVHVRAAAAKWTHLLESMA